MTVQKANAKAGILFFRIIFVAWTGYSVAVLMTEVYGSAVGSPSTSYFFEYLFITGYMGAQWMLGAGALVGAALACQAASDRLQLR